MSTRDTTKLTFTRLGKDGLPDNDLSDSCATPPPIDMGHDHNLRGLFVVDDERVLVVTAYSGHVYLWRLWA